jgi:phosphoenolpyruvate carboxykinase (ATP)
MVRNKHYSDSALIERTLELGLGRLSQSGALVVETGTNTGRSTAERFVVRDENTKNEINWGSTNQPIDREKVETLFQRAIRKVLDGEHYEARGFVSFFPIEVYSRSPWHALFARTMFRREPMNNVAHKNEQVLRVYHDPYGKLSDYKVDLPGEKIILMDFREMRVLIIGTAYAGEIKKSAFAMANYLLPKEGMLTMHSSANTLEDGSETCVLFGLSGTGKTTLSADPGRSLVGDDEILWTDSGISNLEGGCYAKLINLSAEHEPLIYKAVNQSGAIQENVVCDEKGAVDFANGSKAENTRGSYPIGFLDNIFMQSREADHPHTIIFLTADAFGALPAIARLSPEQARYHFLSGYTAKVAGTELGIKEPQAAFSACFGAPFMPLHPKVYADMLSDRVNRFGASVWLLNTGWTGGGYGKGNRFPISVSRALLRAVQSGALDTLPAKEHPVFGFHVPTACPGVDPRYLEIPEGPQVHDLARRFAENFRSKYPDLQPIGGPRL